MLRPSSSSPDACCSGEFDPSSGLMLPHKMETSNTPKRVLYRYIAPTFQGCIRFSCSICYNISRKAATSSVIALLFCYHEIHVFDLIFEVIWFHSRYCIYSVFFFFINIIHLLHY